MLGMLVGWMPNSSESVPNSCTDSELFGIQPGIGSELFPNDSWSLTGVLQVCPRQGPLVLGMLVAGINSEQFRSVPEQSFHGQVVVGPGGGRLGGGEVGGGGGWWWGGGGGGRGRGGRGGGERAEGGGQGLLF